jgi:hypothetical protein
LPYNIVQEGEYSPPDHCKGYSAVHVTSSSAPETLPTSFILLVISQHFCVLHGTYSCTRVPQILWYCTTSRLSRAYARGIGQHFVSTAQRSYTYAHVDAKHADITSRDTCITSICYLFLLACLSLALAGNTNGFAFTSQHTPTADESQNHCWVDSACTLKVSISIQGLAHQCY